MRDRRDERFAIEKVPADHDDDEPAIVADIFAAKRRIEQVGHHRIFAKFVHASDRTRTCVR